MGKPSQKHCSRRSTAVSIPYPRTGTSGHKNRSSNPGRGALLHTAGLASALPGDRQSRGMFSFSAACRYAARIEARIASSS
jgi:hypothetical protein